MSAYLGMLTLGVDVDMDLSDLVPTNCIHNALPGINIPISR